MSIFKKIKRSCGRFIRERYGYGNKGIPERVLSQLPEETKEQLSRKREEYRRNKIHDAIFGTLILTALTGIIIFKNYKSNLKKANQKKIEKVFVPTSDSFDTNINTLDPSININENLLLKIIERPYSLFKIDKAYTNPGKFLGPFKDIARVYDILYKSGKEGLNNLTENDFKVLVAIAQERGTIYENNKKEFKGINWKDPFGLKDTIEIPIKYNGKIELVKISPEKEILEEALKDYYSSVGFISEEILDSLEKNPNYTMNQIPTKKDTLNYYKINENFSPKLQILLKKITNIKNTIESFFTNKEIKSDLKDLARKAQEEFEKRNLNVGNLKPEAIEDSIYEWSKKGLFDDILSKRRIRNLSNLQVSLKILEEQYNFTIANIGWLMTKNYVKTNKKKISDLEKIIYFITGPKFGNKVLEIIKENPEDKKIREAIKKLKTRAERVREIYSRIKVSPEPPKKNLEIVVSNPSLQFSSYVGSYGGLPNSGNVYYTREEMYKLFKIFGKSLCAKAARWFLNREGYFCPRGNAWNLAKKFPKIEEKNLKEGRLYLAFLETRSRYIQRARKVGTSFTHVGICYTDIKGKLRVHHSWSGREIDESIEEFKKRGKKVGFAEVDKIINLGDYRLSLNKYSNERS